MNNFKRQGSPRAQVFIQGCCQAIAQCAVERERAGKFKLTRAHPRDQPDVEINQSQAGIPGEEPPTRHRKIIPVNNLNFFRSTCFSMLKNKASNLCNLKKK